ncbi:hypothetical protein LXL04_022679 [Taraxacum kok-saghyz]
MNDAAGILELPEGCLSEVLSLTSPRDACRAASITKGFTSAADSDAVWERFLPPDYREVIARSVSLSPLVFDTKKQLYLFLSDSHILLDHGHLSFHVDKESGKKCYMLGAKELSIAWQDDSRYWEWRNIPESRFLEVCILRKVWWLEIQGRIPAMVLSPKSTYMAYLVFRTTGESRGLAVPGKTKISFHGIEMETENVYLQRPAGAANVITTMHREDDVFPRRRKDGWMEIKLGEFECDELESDNGEIVMAFDEHRSWKCGLIIEGIELRPK